MKTVSISDTDDFWDASLTAESQKKDGFNTPMISSCSNTGFLDLYLYGYYQLLMVKKYICLWSLKWLVLILNGLGDYPSVTAVSMLWKNTTFKLLKTKKNFLFLRFSVFFIWLCSEISFDSTNSKKYFEQVQLVSTYNICSSTQGLW